MIGWFNGWKNHSTSPLPVTNFVVGESKMSRIITELETKASELEYRQLISLASPSETEMNQDKYLVTQAENKKEKWNRFWVVLIFNTKKSRSSQNKKESRCWISTTTISGVCSMCMQGRWHVCQCVMGSPESGCLTHVEGWGVEHVPRFHHGPL